jgi:hypothetical protein
MNLNVLSAYKRHCDTVVNSECYIEDLYQVLHQSMCPTDSEGVQVDDIDWGKGDEKYDDVPYSEAYHEANKTVTDGVSNSLPFALPTDPLLLPPDNVANSVGSEATDSDNGFCMEDCFMYGSEACM